ncbi:LOW QUALITY PROTEIN: myeloid cell surface antigen CD33-like [Anomaloglossus baeobatrachus]
MWLGLVAVLPLLWKGPTCQASPAPIYDIRVSPDVSVQEGLCVTIPCTFIADSRNTFSNSYGYWRPENSDKNVATNNKSSPVIKSNFHLTGNPDNGDCTLTITDARKEDEGTYYYRFVESKDSGVTYNFGQAKTTITVTDLTEEPVISDPGTLIAGINKTLTCAPPGNCPATSLTFQWRKSNVADVWKKNSSTVIFTPSRDDHQENITCEIINTKGKTTRKTILLDVYSSVHTSMDFTIIIGIVIGNIAALILIFVGTYFFMKKKMENKQLVCKKTSNCNPMISKDTYTCMGALDPIYTDWRWANSQITGTG